MSFLSPYFLLFVAISLATYQLVKARFRPHVLLGASYLFYLTHSPAQALLLLAVTIVVYFIALAVEHAPSEARKLRRVGVSVAVLVTLLAGFKLASALTAPAPDEPASNGAALHVLVPLGLSYYLFKLVGYLLDVYWENVPAQKNFVALSLYASFFPQIVSGPIERAGDFFEQLSRVGRLDPAMVSQGMRRILFGLFKKTAIADRLVVVDAMHANPAAYSSLELLLGAYLFALRLYADFSGVTDIAIGLGQMFGFTGPENFDLPFFARNLQDYWRRWHMSLTSWLADYLFTPLRMALRDKGQVGLAVAILVNMFAVGVWHGASLTYAAFGVYHGVCLTASVLTLKKRDAFFKHRPALARLRAVAAPLGTFHLVVLGLILFRANSFGSALEYLGHLEPRSGGAIAPGRLDLGVLGMTRGALLGIPVLATLMEFGNFATRRSGWSVGFLAAPRFYRWALYYGVILLTLAVSHLGEEKFIYAQF